MEVPARETLAHSLRQYRTSRSTTGTACTQEQHTLCQYRTLHSGYAARYHEFAASPGQCIVTDQHSTVKYRVAQIAITPPYGFIAVAPGSSIAYISTGHRIATTTYPTSVPSIAYHGSSTIQQAFVPVARRTVPSPRQCTSTRAPRSIASEYRASRSRRVAAYSSSCTSFLATLSPCARCSSKGTCDLFGTTAPPAQYRTFGPHDHHTPSSVPDIP
eukprot:3941201-Rhodomonas_salina.2